MCRAPDDTFTKLAGDSPPSLPAQNIVMEVGIIAEFALFLQDKLAEGGPYGLDMPCELREKEGGP